MRLKTLLMTAAMAGAIAAPAYALDFQLYDAGAIGNNAAALKSLTVATDYWSSVLTDDVTVNLLLGVQTSNDGSPVSTEADFQYVTVVPIQTVYEALAADSTSAVDAQAVANLQPLTANNYLGQYGGLTVIVNGFNSTQTGYIDETIRVDNDTSGNTAVMNINPANARAMGLENITGNVVDDTILDGTVRFSSNTLFDYDPTDGIDAGSYDYTGLLIQAIGTVLGLDSRLYYYDEATSPGSTAVINREQTVVSQTIDLFRYSASDTIDWSTSSSDKYFSIDGGDSELFGESSYRTGVLNGDGASASYWKDSETGEALGVMDGSVEKGTGMVVSSLDLAALDAIGWDTSFDVLANSGYRMSTADIYAAMTAVPEPSTWLQMIVGFGLIGSAARYRRRDTTVSFA